MSVLIRHVKIMRVGRISAQKAGFHATLLPCRDVAAPCRNVAARRVSTTHGADRKAGDFRWQLGSWVQCKLWPKVRGRVVAQAQWVTGCNTYIVEFRPKKGEEPKREVFNEERIQILRQTRVVKSNLPDRVFRWPLGIWARDKVWPETSEGVIVARQRSFSGSDRYHLELAPRPDGSRPDNFVLDADRLEPVPDKPPAIQPADAQTEPHNRGGPVETYPAAATHATL